MRASVAPITHVLPLLAGLGALTILLPAAAVYARANPHPTPSKSPTSVIIKRPAVTLPQGVMAIDPDGHGPSLEIDWNAPSESPKAIEAIAVDPVKEARAYLVKTAFPGGTMTMMGKAKSIECFNPNFAVNLAAAVKDARDHGMAYVGVLSGCRPPGLGIGGFRDKFNSLHAYGLAADMHGIGSPGSRQTKEWHAIAARHGVACVYGPYNSAEWNHCQGTKVKVAPQALRKTITAKGPKDLNVMWATAKSIVLAVANPVLRLATEVKESGYRLASVEKPAKVHVAKVHHKVKRSHVAKHHRVHRHRIVRRHVKHRRHVAQLQPRQSQHWEGWN